MLGARGRVPASITVSVWLISMTIRMDPPDRSGQDRVAALEGNGDGSEVAHRDPVSRVIRVGALYRDVPLQFGRAATRRGRHQIPDNVLIGRPTIGKPAAGDRKSTRLNSSHHSISY